MGKIIGKTLKSHLYLIDFKVYIFYRELPSRSLSKPFKIQDV